MGTDYTSQSAGDPLIARGSALGGAAARRYRCVAVRRACIDIGSNTTRLLVADCRDGGLIECWQERAFTQLGRSLEADSRIGPAKLQEVAEVVLRQFRRARELGAEQIRCVATAGVRRASNGLILAELASRLCDGLQVEILTAEQEAHLAFAGAVRVASPRVQTTIAVVDAGGGSTELVVGTAPATVVWWRSVPIGSGDVTARWFKCDPPDAAELKDAGLAVNELFAGLRAPAGVGAVIAVGGSATTLRTLAGSRLDAEALDRLMGMVSGVGAAELARRFGVDVQRARLLAGGLLILGAVARLFQTPLTIGNGGLREGVLLSG